MMAVPTDYERGLAEGELRARLDDHTRRLNTINGSVDETGRQLRALTAQISDLVGVVATMSTSLAASELARQKYVPIIEALERRRLQGLKLWHVAAAVCVLLLPQTLNLILRLSGVAS